MEPGAIDLSFVPRRRPGLATVEVGPEALVVDDQADRPHLLNPTAALVWSFIDGVGSLADFADDLHEVLGAHRSRIERDLVDLASDLDGRGLLADARPDPRSGPLGASATLSEPGVRRLRGPVNPGLGARFDGPETRVVTVRDGMVELGIRVDDAGLAAEVADAISAGGIDAGMPCPVSDRGDPTGEASEADGQVTSARAAEEGHDAPLYSVLLGRAKGPVTGLQLLYRSERPLRRCRHRHDMVRIVAADVSAVLAREAHGMPLLDIVGLTGAGRLLAVDPVFSSIVAALEPGLRRAGIERLDASFVSPLDPASGLEPVGVVLRPASDDGIGTSAAAVALGAADLARGVDARFSAAALAQLCELVTAVPVVRAPGRHGLLAAIRDLLT